MAWNPASSPIQLPQVQDGQTVAVRGVRNGQPGPEATMRLSLGAPPAPTIGSQFDPTQLAQPQRHPNVVVPDWANVALIRAAAGPGYFFTQPETGLRCCIVDEGETGYPSNGHYISKRRPDGAYAIVYHDAARNNTNYRIVDFVGETVGAKQAGPVMSDETKIMVDPFDHDALYYWDNASKQARKWRFSTGGDVTEDVWPIDFSGQANVQATCTWMQPMFDFDLQRVEAVSITNAGLSHIHVWRRGSSILSVPMSGASSPGPYVEAYAPVQYTGSMVVQSGAGQIPHKLDIATGAITANSGFVTHPDFDGPFIFTANPNSSFAPHEQINIDTDTTINLVDESDTPPMCNAAGHTFGHWTEQHGKAQTARWHARTQEHAQLQTIGSFTLDGSDWRVQPVAQYQETRPGSVFRGAGGALNSMAATLTEVGSRGALVDDSWYWDGSWLYVQVPGGGDPTGSIVVLGEDGPHECIAFVKSDQASPDVRRGPLHYANFYRDILNQYDERSRGNQSPDGIVVTCTTNLGQDVAGGGKTYVMATLLPSV